MAGRQRSGVVFTFGQQLTAAQLEQLPKGRIGFSRQVANIGNVDSSETTVVVDDFVTVGSSRTVEVHGQLQIQVDSSDALSTVALELYQGSTLISLAEYHLPYVAGQAQYCDVDGDATGSAGTFSFSLKVFRVHGTSTLTVLASTTNPAFIKVTDVGPDF